jgi:hypothetical protein
VEGPESALGLAWSEDVRSEPREMFVDLIHTRFARPSTSRTKASAS